jgi:hypothetical protein
MPISLSQNPKIEIRCPDKLGIITLMIRGVHPLKKWFPSAEVRIVVAKKHHHWLKQLIQNITLSETNTRADYIIEAPPTPHWYTHRWNDIFIQFKRLGLCDLSEFSFPTNVPPPHLASQHTPIVTEDPEFAQWMAVWNIPVIWICEPSQFNPLHWGPLGVTHTIVTKHQFNFVGPNIPLNMHSKSYPTINPQWSQLGLSIRIIGPAGNTLKPLLLSAGYHVVDDAHVNLANTIIYYQTHVPLKSHVKRLWTILKSKCDKRTVLPRVHPPLLLKADSFFEFERQLAIAQNSWQTR